MVPPQLQCLPLPTLECILGDVFLCQREREETEPAYGSSICFSFPPCANNEQIGIPMLKETTSFKERKKLDIKRKENFSFTKCFILQYT